MASNRNKTMENDIILIAKQLIEDGKTPSVANIKGKLTSPIAMPIIIKVLQKISGLSVTQLDAMLHREKTSFTKSAITNKESLQSQINALTNELAQVTSELSQLKKQFHQYIQDNNQS